MRYLNLHPASSSIQKAVLFLFWPIFHPLPPAFVPQNAKKKTVVRQKNNNEKDLLESS